MNYIRIGGILVKSPLFITFTGGYFLLFLGRTAWREFGWNGRSSVAPGFVELGRGAVHQVEIDYQLPVILAIHHPGQRELLFIAAANRARRPQLGLRKSREQHRRQDGDDGNHHEQFDERKPPVPA